MLYKIRLLLSITTRIYLRPRIYPIKYQFSGDLRMTSLQRLPTISLYSSIVFISTLISITHSQSLAAAVFQLGNGTVVQLECVQIIYQGTSHRILHHKICNAFKSNIFHWVLPNPNLVRAVLQFHY